MGDTDDLPRPAGEGQPLDLVQGQQRLIPQNRELLDAGQLRHGDVTQQVVVRDHQVANLLQPEQINPVQEPILRDIQI